MSPPTGWCGRFGRPHSEAAGEAHKGRGAAVGCARVGAARLQRDRSDPPRRTWSTAARRPTAGAGRWPACGTRRCSTPSGATSRPRPSTPATSSMSRPPCGTRGLRSTRWRTATSSTRRSMRVRGGRRCRGRPGGGDQLRRLPDPAPPLLPGRRAGGDVRRAVHDDGVTLLPHRSHGDRGRLARRARQPDRRGRHRGRSRRRLARVPALCRHGLPGREPPTRRRPAGNTMRDPNRWQPLALNQIVAQNGLPIPGECSGSSDRSGAACRPSPWIRRPVPCRSIPARRRASAIRRRRRLQTGRARRHRGQQPARCRRRRDDRHLARRDRRQPARHQRRRRLRTEPGHRRAVCAERRGPGRLRSGPGRVLG